MFSMLVSPKFILSLLGIIALFALAAWYVLFRDVPDPYQASNVAGDVRFKYASVGTEAIRGVPYWIWIVMPKIFSEHLPGPGGYTSLGMTWEDGYATPVGFAKKEIGIIPRAGLNCAICHAATYRKNAAEVISKPTIVPAGGSPRFDLHSYQ